MSTCLVVACWSGHRRQLTPRYEEDRGYFLRLQAHHLRVLDHSLARVILVVPENADEPPAFREALDSFPRVVGRAPVEVLERPNHGLSYGSWDEALHRTWRDHDHHILVEDDYLFTEDGFDRTMAAWHDSIPDCGYLCGLVQQAGPRRFAGLSNGILRGSHYPVAAAPHGGRMPWTPGQVPGDNHREYLDEGGQVAFGHAWEAGGKTLYDLTGFCSVAWYMNGFVRCRPHPSGRLPLAPVQLVEWLNCGIPEAELGGYPAQERTMFPYPPPQWFHDKLKARKTQIPLA